MAMNFKIFDSRGIASKYAADIVRKQMNNNPTSIMAFALNDEAADFHRELYEDAVKNPLDMSQIHVFSYDKDKAAFQEIGTVDSQYHEIGRNTDLMGEVKKVKTKENKGKLTMLVSTLNADGSIGYREVNAGADEGLLAAREIVLLVTGRDKAEVINKLYHSNQTQTTFEAGNLKVHRMVTVVMDIEAAQGLPEDVREYYRVLFS